eukprot:Plantae.Rhodophyta-Hildenbrandia_rubra.ctg18561.p1 GENE.Plantae.Rhodophyta-Hildenbrandia_rubra.ctg18561~~Plantae.Rhodophyta-Hildenbrandia_rubra.ctg18561.p1  ORF type:complete len:114 (-),score=14.23 Plantae.Rhodophyta-Hildenbrandia_rubra.ctg18561:1471-1812(-)
MQGLKLSDILLRPQGYNKHANQPALPRNSTVYATPRYFQGVVQVKSIAVDAATMDELSTHNELPRPNEEMLEFQVRNMVQVPSLKRNYELTFVAEPKTCYGDGRRFIPCEQRQ